MDNDISGLAPNALDIFHIQLLLQLGGRSGLDGHTRPILCPQFITPPIRVNVVCWKSSYIRLLTSDLIPSCSLKICSIMVPSFFLLLFFLFSFCCGAAIITHLPGFSGDLPFYLETGYVGVDEVQFFYYFIESEGNPREDPVLLWLTGGPGCSAFSGLAFEIGPLNFRNDKYNGSLPSLVYNPFSWTKVSSIIFLDSPVGTGFSFSRDSGGVEVGDITSSKQVHKFLLKWFIEHPQFLANHLYIAGDSYAGKLVPIIADMISEGIEVGYQLSLNLKGYLVGNPVTGDKIDVNSKVPYLHGVGIISDELYELTTRSCEGEDHRSPKSAECAVALDAVQKFISEIQTTHILEPKCARALARPHNKRFLKEDYDELQVPPPVPDIWCRSYPYFLSYYWANNNITREALHIEKGSVREWQRCNYDLNYIKEIPSSIKYHLNLTSKGYRALVYSGDHDTVIPFLGTQAWIRSLNFSIVDDWRSWHVSGQIAGYTITYTNNMTFTTVKGAGHTAPEYRPKECLAMFHRWIFQEPL